MLFGLIFSLALFPLYSWNVSIIFISSFIFDLDHYLYFVIKKRKFGLKEAHSFFRKTHDKKDLKLMRTLLMIFHTVEFYLIVFVLSFFYELFLFVFLGLILHAMLDAIDEINTFGEIKAWSIIVFIFKRKNIFK